MAQDESPSPGQLPRTPVDRIVAPLARFLHVEAASGIALLAVTALALILANSPASESFLGLWKTPLGFEFGSFEVRHSLKHWINDGLMAILFFVIGLEVKRELVLGELRDRRRAALPIAAALGGMIAPAGIYLAFQFGEPGERGWGIPMATDIAFVVGCMAVLGSRIPRSLRVMLLSLAIADDIGAVLVIAFGYTSDLSWAALGLGVLGIGAVLGLTGIGVRSTPIYVVVGTLVWFAFHESGVHATIAGVILGLITPTRSWLSDSALGEIVEKTQRFARGGGWNVGAERHAALRQMEQAARETLSPLERLETTMHPWVGFAIMPLFAFANAGVPFEVRDFRDPIAAAVIAGLVVGKPVGIVLFSWLAVRLGLATLPDGVGWKVLAAAGLLAGIGFTMAIFIASLALDEALLDGAKVGVLLASTIAAIGGMALLTVLLPKR